MPVHPFLTWFEALVIRQLIKSPRIGAICVKQYGREAHWLLRDSSEGLRQPSLSYDDPRLGTPWEAEEAQEAEPASMLLERLYHMPDAEER